MRIFNVAEGWVVVDVQVGVSIIPKVEDVIVRYELLFYHIRTDHGTVERQRVWNLRHETVFSCASSTMAYLMCIAIIYTGCLR